MVKIDGIDKAELFMALYNNANEHFGYGSKGYMTIEDARKEVSGGDYDWTHIRGVPINFSFIGNEMFERVYDLNCGIGAAQRIIDDLKGRRP